MVGTRCPVRVAVVGVGAVGGYLAWQLARSGAELLLCARAGFDSLTVTSEGRTYEIAARVVTTPQEVFDGRPVDVLVLSTKAHDTDLAAGWLRALAGAGTLVVIAQNGIDQQERVRPLAPDAALLPALVYAAGVRESAGRIAHLGGHRVVVPAGPGAERLAEVLRRSQVDLVATADFATTAWRKMLSNLAANALTALTGRPLGALVEPPLRGVAVAVVREGMAVAAAEGARLPSSFPDELLALWASYPPATGSSMLNDRRAGRPLEYDALTGAVVRRARTHGIATPCNDVLLALLQGCEVGAGG